MKRYSSIALVMVSIAAADIGRAQDQAAGGIEAAMTRKKKILEAFKADGGPAAIVLVRGNVDQASTRHVDLQVGDQLRELCYWLLNERHPRVMEAADLAIAESEKARGRITAAEEADLAAENGRICEAVIGNLSRAKAYYQQALRLSSQQAEATRGLERIGRLERLAADKARENEVLRNRKQSQAPRS